ncbi:MAG TPA: FtsW/RodA/SpoVE family cell cycle protein [Roseiflexaceae bacterium]|nr:FtsW/RodA/SpoVE family cell cycle protein [Roseiflexaceae bacterium]
MTRSWRDLNLFLLGCVLVLTGFGMVLVYSATLRHSDTQGYFARHLANLLVGGVAMVGLTLLDYHVLQAWAGLLYLGGVIALLVVLVMGHVRGGAQSWLDLGMRTLQPSEPAKLLIIIALAAYWARFEDRGGDTKVQLGGLILAGVPLGLVFIQPDFGTSMVFATVWLATAWVAGLRWWHLLGLLVAAAPVAYIGWTEVLNDNQKLRLLIFIDPLGYDPTLQNGAWDITQSINAISSGGMLGSGWTQGVITQGRYIQAQYSDFIFSTAAEELGFVGATVLLVFLGILLWQGLAVAARSRDRFGKMLAVGVTAMLFCHIFINIGVTMTIMPVTGIPLPFVSYGGSFSLTTFAAIGLLESVALRQRRIMF